MSSNPPSGACARQRGLHHQANERLHGLRGRRRRELRGQPRAGRRRLAAAVATALATVLATLPTASAFASAGPSLPNGGAGTAKRSGLAVGRLALPGELLSTGQLQSLLAALPLSDLSAKQLARYLAGLEGIGVLTKLETGLLSGKQLGAVGLEESLREAIEKLGAGAGAGA
ncbi:MAG TPA: hypothetical protein VNV37_00095, partial [Solirubrobacteraceae bacterium]|nr:hypothetical protein [Solirubrobacteraceae bacterium]